VCGEGKRERERHFHMVFSKNPDVLNFLWPRLFSGLNVG
jgi:hypothetical protein